MSDVPNQPAVKRAAALAAYDRGDDDAAERLASVLALLPLDGGLLIAAATLALEERQADALDRLEAMLRRAPDWLDGHVALAGLRWGASDHDGFLAPIEDALRMIPHHAGLWTRYMNLLADSGQTLRAADCAADLRRRGGDVPALRLIEATHAGSIGANDRANELIASLPPGTPGRARAAARQRLRTGDAEASVRLLDEARAGAPHDVLTWALTELAWRAVGDPRHDWLIDDAAIIRRLPIAIDPMLAADLAAIHRKRWPVLGQSIRAGTQTRGHLGHRREPSIAALFKGLEQAVADHVAALPRIAADHPLGAGRSGSQSIVAAWSVRLSDAGHHVSHVHPGGRFSSALHIAANADRDDARREGWLELGRPPSDLPIGLEPLAAFPPIPGQLTLFPSFLYHRTVPFRQGERIAVAFDVS